MLPKQILDPIDNFVHAFDAEFPAESEFGKALKKVKLERLRTGVGWGSADVASVGKDINAYLQRKAQYVWKNLQDVVTSTQIDFYPELNADLKLYLANHFNPALQAAEQYMNKLQRDAHCASAYTVQTRQGFRTVLPKINAAVDLFCVGYMNEKKPSSHPRNIGKLTGIHGNVTNSHIIINDHSVHD